MEATENVRVKFSNSAAKDKSLVEWYVATDLRPIGLPVLRVAEVCEGTGHKNAQPTHPERNAQAADLHLPSKDDPQEMDYRHDEKQRSGDRHIGFSVQSAYPSASRPIIPIVAYGSSRMTSTRYVR
jgi:hypothetical protein